ncbi:ribosome small subunit-dependent GTPase A [Finegoldia magna]|uniref:Small ribosomal subunit biogenesis GTPase RsgA n=1 Tax=Finegoldia magna TaxID=1260 RepID=A0A133MY33_FINMA|nr:ribosome small subunit-dependent GTPase A [Finegoldia magna]MDU7142657.1 ribosome small subunit-dependent GTPase A [Anaerococcus vaginalis]EFK93697.1 ribosome small subunit-dependent GTPase A [Finegoldia magna ACS-171-V-Col3]EGS33762.1 ribosome small subunit-dependent GTPase A [Finegoldia magna SY403409CC001050417]EXF26989.1 GTPase [Finegoldia magna ALB8]KXA08955.1 ribosome small subunit-dependent GTPase A [Finegoldia magna]
MSDKTGIITKIQRELFYVSIGNNVYPSKAKGNFRNKKITPVVGDKVDIHVENGLGFILKIHPRSVLLHRPEVSNVDKCFVLTSIKSPNINLMLLDKYLLMIEKNNIDCVIVFNKSDLVSENERNLFAEIYRNIGYKVIFNSNESSHVNEELLKEFKNHISCVIGPSGAGKSSTLKKLFPNENFVSGKISEKTQRGKQTTRHIEIKMVDENTYVLDTPGFSSFDLSFLKDKSEIKNNFLEFRKNSSKCKFNNCEHINEPKCEIKKLLESGEISKSRYDNYLKIVEEYEKLRRY